MRLFRKSKAGVPDTQTSIEIQELTETRPSSPCVPCPPPALQLNLQLPSLTSSSLIFGKSGLIPDSNESIQQHHQQHQGDISAPTGSMKNYELASGAYSMADQSEARASPQTILNAIEQRRTVAAANTNSDGPNAPSSYNFDYLLHFAEQSNSEMPQESSVQKMLLEQYGKVPVNTAQQSAAHSYSNYTATTTMASGIGSNSAANVAAAPAYSTPITKTTLVEVIQARQKQVGTQKTKESTNSNANENTYHRTAGSPISRDDSSTSSANDDGVQKLNSSMAAMSIGNTSATNDSGKKLSERALNIQKVREASALGKVVAFNRSAIANIEMEDETDSIPLGGLRKLGNGSTQEGIGSLSGAGLYQAHGSTLHGSLINDGQMNAAKYQASMQMQMQSGVSTNVPAFHTQQQQQQQYQQGFFAASASPMPHVVGGSLSTGARTPAPMFSANNSGNSSPAAMSQSGFPIQAGVPMRQQGISPLSIAQMQQQQQQQLMMQQMAYQQSTMGGVARASMLSNTSASFGNIGLTRAAAGMPEGLVATAKPMYTPSPLGQMPPIYGQQGMAHYQQAMVARQLPNTMANMQVHRSVMQQPPPGIAANSQQAALTSFIPSQSICQGSISRNPLMRDLNKIKEFSAKDYNARPTLLAEVDSRMLAKKAMPGLGGISNHSFQPENVPSRSVNPPISPTLRHKYSSISELPEMGGRADHSQRDYYDRHYGSSHKYNPGYEKSMSCQNLYGMCSDNASVSSGGSSKRNLDARDGGKGLGRNGREHKRRHRHGYDYSRGDAYGSEYSERGPPREFRRMEAQPPPRGYRALGRHGRNNWDDRYYEQYDYEDSSDIYASDCYDEWGEDEYEGYYDNDDIGTHYRRRNTAHRKPRTKQRLERGKMPAHWRPPPRNGRGDGIAGYHRGEHGKRLQIYLDDPRGNSDVAYRVAPDIAEKAGSVKSQSSITSATPVKPRSQFGRILANIRRQSGAEPNAPAQSALVDQPAQQKTSIGSSEPSNGDQAQAEDRTSLAANRACSSSESVVSRALNSQVNSVTCTPTTQAAAPVAAV
ncbi:hypothetical protein GGI25_005199 [Coemansia spiralis]|uniref:Uncharacterized protein n=1 Tax=Coemansia spiralis TaxID=417178 RepID=A0A9W8KWP9_9FUNG|nr:hypothetical protein GGI25_005199 [Coemansia spiralis]